MTFRADDLAAQLRSLETAVADLSSSLATLDLVTGVAAANAMVVRTTDLLKDRTDHGGHDHEVFAELVSALNVFRNAAFAFRGLAGSTGNGEEELVAACAAMIEQGRDHLQRFHTFYSREDPNLGS
jgi:hypothetical protein